jgi:hypothetical protein
MPFLVKFLLTGLLVISLCLWTSLLLVYDGWLLMPVVVLSSIVFYTTLPLLLAALIILAVVLSCCSVCYLLMDTCYLPILWVMHHMEPTFYHGLSL